MKRVLSFVLAVLVWFTSMQLSYAGELPDFEEENDVTKFAVSFVVSEFASVTAYDTQDISIGGTENAAVAYARDSVTGEIDSTGEGQVNFVVTAKDGYIIDSIDVIDGSTNFKNLKLVSGDEKSAWYRLTKVKGDIVVEITCVEATEVIDPEIPVDPEVPETPEIIGIPVSFATVEGATVTVYPTKDLTEDSAITDLSGIVARNGDTGEVDNTGEGQINFTVDIQEGYSLLGVSVSEGAGNYKNIKLVSEEGVNPAIYRITKITGPITINVEMKCEPVESTESLISEIEFIKGNVTPYYNKYYTEETASAYEAYVSSLAAADLTAYSLDELHAIIDELNSVIASLEYKTSTVPMVYISTTDGVGNSLVKDTGYVSTQIAIVDSDGSVLEDSASIKVRGNSTAMAPKKPFNIKFNSKKNVLGMGSAKKWNLLANCFDASLMRNAVAFDIAHTLGLSYTSDITYAELWIDGVFKGCYQLCEAVEAGPTRVDIDLDAGEFLIQIEKSRDEEGVFYFTDDNDLRFAFKEPEEPTDAQYANVKAVMNDIVKVVNSGDYEEVCNVLDIESFVKFYILNEYIRNYDFNFSSTYFFYKGGKLYAGPAWDFDLSSGNTTNENRLRTDYPSASVGNVYPFLLKYSEFQDAVKECYAEYSDYLDSITAEGGLIDTFTSVYGDIYARNYTEAGWAPSRRYHAEQGTPLETFEENVGYFKNWLTDRKEWMDSYIPGLIPNVWVNDIHEAENCISLEWRAVDGVEKYGIYRRTADTTMTRIAVVKGGNTYLDYSAEAGVEYFYDVVAIVGETRGSITYRGYKAVLSEKKVNEFAITKQPVSVVLDEQGETAEFTVEATGDGVTYNWYVMTPDSERFIKTGVTTNTYTRKIYDKTSGIQVYCVIADAYGNKINSDTVTAVISNELKIVSQPTDIFAAKQGAKMNFVVKAKGQNLSYSWYYKNADGDGMFHKAGVYTDTYTRSASLLTDGMQVYCVVKDENGNKVVSEIATAYLGRVEVSVCGNDTVFAKEGEKITFEAEGKAMDFVNGEVSFDRANVASYTWYYMIPVENGGDGIFHKAGTGVNYSRTGAARLNGMQVYCIAKDSYGNKATSNTVTVIVE